MIATSFFFIFILFLHSQHLKVGSAKIYKLDNTLFISPTSSSLPIGYLRQLSIFPIQISEIYIIVMGLVIPIIDLPGLSLNYLIEMMWPRHMKIPAQYKPVRHPLCFCYWQLAKVVNSFCHRAFIKTKILRPASSVKNTPCIFFAFAPPFCDIWFCIFWLSNFWGVKGASCKKSSCVRWKLAEKLFSKLEHFVIAFLTNDSS